MEAVTLALRKQLQRLTAMEEFQNALTMCRSILENSPDSSFGRAGVAFFTLKCLELGQHIPSDSLQFALDSIASLANSPFCSPAELSLIRAGLLAFAVRGIIPFA
jgi:hypothetical protein